MELVKCVSICWWYISLLKIYIVWYWIGSVVEGLILLLVFEWIFWIDMELWEWVCLSLGFWIGWFVDWLVLMLLFCYWMWDLFFGLFIMS